MRLDLEDGWEYEIETKIVTLPSPTLYQLRERIGGAGGQFMTPQRPVVSDRFKIRKGGGPVGDAITFPGHLVVDEDLPKLPALLRLLGLQKIVMVGLRVQASIPTELPDRRLRIRMDSRHMTLTVKTPVKDDQGVDVRTTCEVRLIGSPPLVTGFANRLGYTANRTEKVRETWRLPNGARVEIDTRANFFWLEVEAATEKRVRDGVGALGYTEHDMWAVTEERTLRFFRGEKDLPKL